MKHFLLGVCIQGVIVVSILLVFSVVRFGNSRYEMIQRKEASDRQHSVYSAAVERMVSLLSSKSIDDQALLRLKLDAIDLEQSTKGIGNEKSIYVLNNSVWKVLEAIEKGQDRINALLHLNDSIEAYNASRIAYSQEFKSTFWSLKDYTF